MLRPRDVKLDLSTVHLDLKRLDSALIAEGLTTLCGVHVS